MAIKSDEIRCVVQCVCVGIINFPRKNTRFLGKWWVRGGCHIYFPENCCDGKQAQLVSLVDGGVQI